MIDTQRTETYSKLDAADATELVAVELDRKAVMLCHSKHLFRFGDVPSFFLDKDVYSYCQPVLYHFRDESLADFLYITRPAADIQGRYMNE